MAVKIHDWNMDRIIYQVVPEQVTDQEVKEYDEKLDLDREVNGWTADRTLRKTGEVPFSVLYNYALSKGVQSTRMWDFFKANNCKEMKRLLNEFEVFRCGKRFKGKL
jgi:hypothetical protein